MSKQNLSDYGSINYPSDRENLLEENFSKSTDYSKRENVRNKSRKKFSKYKSDSFLNYLPTSSGAFDNSLNLRRDSLRSVIVEDVEEEEEFQSSGEFVLSQTLCKCSYIVEPVAFIQNLATSIMAISLGQFIYNRILTRLINEFNKTSLVIEENNREYFLGPSYFSSNDTQSCQSSQPPPNGTFHLNHHHHFSLFLNFMSRANMFARNSFFGPLIMTEENNQFKNAFGLGISPEDFEKIRTQAQSETAHLYFVSAIFSGIPVIIMTNLLGVNCSNLGRKTLMLIYLSVMTVKFGLILFQCIYPDWPDWLFYLGAFIEGISGSGGVFYLSLYCYIADLTSPSSRSYRITLLNNLNSVASLCVTFLCGYVIKYYGYFYLFLASLCFMFLSLVYTIFLIPEPLINLKDKTIWQRLKTCSVKKTLNCFKVYFSKEKQRVLKEREENQSVLNNHPQSEIPRLSRNTFVLLLIVFANFIYNFGTIGIGSIFTLFIMNAPYCFDSVQISNYSVFSTLISLLMSLFVSKFVKINDVLVCIFSVASYFASVLCYIYGNSIYHIYIGAIIASIAGLEYGYVRSIVSKSVEKSEVSDALSLILIVDTIIAVASSVLFPILYSSIVSKGIGILFSFSNGFILIALICHIVNYFLYEPVKASLVKNTNKNGLLVKQEEQEEEKEEESKVRTILGQTEPVKFVSLSDEIFNSIDFDTFHIPNEQPSARQDRIPSGQDF